MGDSETILSDQVQALLAVERTVAQALDQQSELTRACSTLHDSLETIRACSRSQGRDLEQYLHERDLGLNVPPSPIASLLAGLASTSGLTRVLCADYAAFSFAASEYAVLTELSLRLYDPALRELAPRHLGAYARAVRSLSYLLPSVVVQELDRRGLDCRCICPMCSIGACGCTVAGRSWIGDAWREARPEVDRSPGLTLSSPRRASQLADNDVRAGDRLVGIDDQLLTTCGWDAIGEIQAAIRTHEIGSELVMQVKRGSEQPRKIRVRHINDYPSD